MGDLGRAPGRHREGRPYRPSHRSRSAGQRARPAL